MDRHPPTKPPFSPFGEEQSVAPPAASRCVKAVLFSATVFLAVWAGAAVWTYLRHELTVARDSAERELATIADLKVRQIRDWREERLADARLIMNHPFGWEHIDEFLRGGRQEEGTREQIEEWLRHLCAHNQCLRTALLDTQGRVRLAYPDAETDVEPVALDLAAQAMRSREATVSDLHRSQTTGTIHLDILVPLPLAPGQKGAVRPDAVGVVLLQVDPELFLYPRIQSWPTFTRTGETLLVRREGNEVVYLNDLRFRENAALRLRLPADRPGRPSALVLAGEEGFVAGTDYRDVPVLAALRQIPGTSWCIEAKVDQDEIYGPLRVQARAATMLLAILILAAILGGGCLWRQRESQWLNRELAAERANQRKFRAIFDNTLQSMGLLRPDGTLLAVNRAARELVGEGERDVVGQPFWKSRWWWRLSKAQRRRLKRAVETARRGAVEQFEVEFPARDGEPHDFDFSLKPVCDEAGEVALLVVEARDVSERQQLERSLRESEQTLRSIADSAHDAILLMEESGGIAFWNAAAERIFGYSAEEALGKNLHAMISPPRIGGPSPEALEHFAQSGKGRAVGTTLELTALRRDGSEFPVELSLSGVRLRGRWHAVGIVRDISDRKQAEDALRVTNERLEQAIAQAEEAAVRAEWANAAKSEFLANTSHEIRTPLNGVIGMVGLLLDTELSPQQRKYGEIVQSSARALLTVINDVLDFSKIEARKMSLETLDFDLGRVFAEAVEIVGPRAREKSLPLKALIDAGVPTRLRGDPGRLRQILLNLAGNAVKFTERGEVTVRASLAREDDCRATICFAVTDTGIGVPPDRREALFAPFVQVDNSMTRKYGGTGLGLAISRQLVDMMGGQIGVESELGRGSTFWFTVVLEKQPPRAPSAEDAEDLPAESTEPAREAAEVVPVPEAGAGRVVRILLAEDNSTNQLVALSMLKRLGYRADAVANGQEAVKALGNIPYDAVLMDCQMPEMDGYEATRRIRAGEAGPSNHTVPVIAMTAHAMQGDRERCLAEGMSDYLAKPVELSGLAETLARWVKEPPQAARLGGQRLAVLRKDELLNRVLGDLDLARRVVAGFLDDVPRQLEQLKERLASGDAPRVELHAHTIKGAAMTIGAQALRQAASATEQAGKAGQLESAAGLVDRVEREFDRLKAALAELDWN